MNDRGLNGDQTIGDNEWTTMVTVAGLDLGDVPISVEVIDEWGEVDVLSTNMTIENQAPRILSATISPETVVRVVCADDTRSSRLSWRRSNRC